MIWKGFQVLDRKAIHDAETSLFFFSCGNKILKIHFFSITVPPWAMGFYTNSILSAKAWTILFRVTDFSIWPHLSSLKWAGLSWKEAMGEKKAVSVGVSQMWSILNARPLRQKKRERYETKLAGMIDELLDGFTLNCYIHNRSMAALSIGWLMFGQFTLYNHIPSCCLNLKQLMSWHFQTVLYR